MSESANTNRLFIKLMQVFRTILPVVVSVACVLVGLIFFDRLPLLILGALGLAAGLAMLRWPDSTTVITIGLIYSNLPVVAVHFHGAPAIWPAVVLAMFTWPLFYHIVLRREKVLFLSAGPFLLMFVVVQLMGVMRAHDPRLSFQNFVSFLLEGAILYFVITNVVRTRRVVIATFWVLAGCAILMGGVPLFQQLTGTFETNYGGLAQMASQFKAGEDAVEGVVRQQRTAGSIGEQNRYAQCMVMLAPIGACLILMSRAAGPRLFAVAAALAALIGASLAFSRGTAVAVVLAFGIAVWLRLISRNQLKWVLIGVIFVLLLLPQYVTRLSTLGTLTDAAGSGDAGLNEADGSIRGRITEMGGALLAFRDHPLIGVGPGMYAKMSQKYGQFIGYRSLAAGREAHSMPLDIAAESGLLGLIAITGVFLVTIRQLLRVRALAIRRNDHEGMLLATGILMSVILYATTGFFLHLSYIRYFWLIIAFANAIGYIVTETDRDEIGKAKDATIPAH